MHEVINLSCSQKSGHLITQLYNVQESHLIYTKTKVASHSNDVFLVSRKVNGKSNYYPRGLNVEFSGGYGYLGKYEYAEPATHLDMYDSVEIQRQTRQPKPEFQVCLDAGKAPNKSLLSTENTAYWTHYNKLIYKPESLVSLGNFLHPHGTHKNFSRLRFDDYDVGVDEFKAQSEQIDDFFRKSLEQLDQIQGVSFFSDCDSAWAGFTNEMTVFLRDEYFGNGVSSKYNLWSYGLMNPRGTGLRIEALLTRIRALTEFAANSTLFMPLSPPNGPEGMLLPAYEKSSLWHQGAVESMFVNSLWGLNCQVHHPISMATIESNLLRGSGRRNIVNEIGVFSQEQEGKMGKMGKYENLGKMEVPGNEAAFGAVDVNAMDMYLKAGVSGESLGPSDLPSQSVSPVNLGMTLISNEHVFSKGIICPSLSDNRMTTLATEFYVNPNMDEITKSNTFPDIIGGTAFQTEFAQTAALRPLLKDYTRTLQRVKHPRHEQILGDKAEVIESLSVLIDEYATSGFSDESDFDD